MLDQETEIEPQPFEMLGSEVVGHAPPVIHKSCFSEPETFGGLGGAMFEGNEGAAKGFVKLRDKAAKLR